MSDSFKFWRSCWSISADALSLHEKGNTVMHTRLALKFLNSSISCFFSGCFCSQNARYVFITFSMRLLMEEGIFQNQEVQDR
jgi:hypothetical protein